MWQVDPMSFYATTNYRPFGAGRFAFIVHLRVKTPGLVLKSLRDSKSSPPVHIFNATPQNPFEDEDDDEDDYERRGTRSSWLLDSGS